jgi:hypothetical protein
MSGEPKTMCSKCSHSGCWVKDSRCWSVWGALRLPWRFPFHFLVSESQMCFALGLYLGSCVTHQSVCMPSIVIARKGAQQHLPRPSRTPRMAFPCLHACNNLALLAIGHDAIVGLRCSLAPGQKLRRTKRHILRERDPVSVCAKALDSSTEIGAIFKAAALIAPMQNTETASGADLRQAHEVELIGGVDINEHLHHAREQCEGDAEGWG